MLYALCGFALSNYLICVWEKKYAYVFFSKWNYKIEFCSKLIYAVSITHILHYLVIWFVYRGKKFK